MFCIYIDQLLFNLEANSIGYFNGKMFIGSLAYADDVVPIAQTSHAMHHMLSTCDSLADNFLIVFKAKKSKFFIFDPTRKSGSFINPKPGFFTLWR